MYRWVVGRMKQHETGFGSRQWGLAARCWSSVSRPIWLGRFRQAQPPSAVLCLIPALAFGDLSEPLPEWWSVPLSHPDAVARPDIGLPGQPETAPPLSDIAALGGAYTKAFLSMAPQDVQTEQFNWARRSTRFGLETVVGVPGGLSFGIDAIDDQLIHRLSDDEARWELAQPRGGLRLGVGANALHTLSREGEWVWGWSAWLPLLDRTGEMEFQTGVRHARFWRLDAAWAMRLLRQKARRADSLLDTTTLRSEETRLSLRFGGQTRSGSTFQTWGGWRRLEDPRGTDDFRSVRLAANGLYLGAQATSRWRKWDMEGEGRMEQGNDTLRTDRSSTEHVEASVEHLLLAGNFALDAPWWGPLRPRLEGTGAFLDLDDAKSKGEFPMLPVGVTHSGGGSLLRLGGTGVLRIRTKWVDVLPRLGAHQVRLAGELPQVWAGLWPLTEGSAWLGEVGGAVQWSSGTSRASYRTSWLPVLDGSRGSDLGFSHRIELYQGF